MRSGRVVFSLLLVVGALIAAGATQRFTRTAQAGARTGFSAYLHRTNGDFADPVNLVFHGTLAQAAAAIQQTLGWAPVQGSEMIFYDRGKHLPTGMQFGFDLGDGSRYHIRLEAVQSSAGQTYVLSGVHRDDTVACGHVGRAFNTARDLVASTFASAGYDVGRIELQNSRPGRQCDGSYTFGDGTAAVINLGGGAVSK